MFRRICNPPKFTIRICNPLKPHIYKMMYVGERIANPHLETAGLQIRRNKCFLDSASERGMTVTDSLDYIRM